MPSFCGGWLHPCFRPSHPCTSAIIQAPSHRLCPSTSTVPPLSPSNHPPSSPTSSFDTLRVVNTRRNTALQDARLHLLVPSCDNRQLHCCFRNAAFLPLCRLTPEPNVVRASRFSNTIASTIIRRVTGTPWVNHKAKSRGISMAPRPGQESAGPLPARHSVCLVIPLQERPELA